MAILGIHVSFQGGYYPKTNSQSGFRSSSSSGASFMRTLFVPKLLDGGVRPFEKAMCGAVKGGSPRF